MNKKLAQEFIAKIEDLRAEEAIIWDEMRKHPEYIIHEDKSVREILENRASARCWHDQAMADLDAFDLEFTADGELIEKS